MHATMWRHTCVIISFTPCDVISVQPIIAGITKAQEAIMPIADTVCHATRGHGRLSLVLPLIPEKLIEKK